MKPILYITATPIGSLSDISAHAKDVLTNADLILCEDTRSTQHLLNALQIKNRHLESLHGHNEKAKTPYLIEKIITKKLKIIVLVSDAGTPAISDPGAFFVEKAHENYFQVLSVPGPTSFACALAASGFNHPRHIFSGFLPRTLKKQHDEFSRWTFIAPCIAVFFESPERILSTIKNLNVFFHPETRVSLSREISKKFEENIVLNLGSAYSFLESKKEILGEFVVCVEVLPNTEKIIEKKETQSLKDECKVLSEKYGINPKELYSFIVKNS